MKYGLIGAVQKENNDFMNANKIDTSNIKVRISMEEADRLLANKEKPVLEFPEVSAIPLTR